MQPKRSNELVDFRSNRKGKTKLTDHYAEWVNDKLESILYGDDESLKENIFGE